MTKTLFFLANYVSLFFFCTACSQPSRGQGEQGRLPAQVNLRLGHLDNVGETNTAVGGIPCPTDSSTGRSQPLQESEWANPISSQNLFNEVKALSPDPSKLHVDLRLSAI